MAVLSARYRTTVNQPADRGKVCRVADSDPLISYGEMSALAGVARSTLRKYRSEGRLPPPDDDSVPDRPRWRVSTFEKWLKERPGRGARTDLRGRGDKPAE